MPMDEIEKLRLRVEKDPNSRLFLPLAEEYRKSGMLDEAISVILRGLERHPGYTSARVALGKIYFEKSMVAEAKREFEKVVLAVPDNLFAQRKLADICRELGETENAIAGYKKVIQLNPLDEDARIFLDELEGPKDVGAGLKPARISPDIREEEPWSPASGAGEPDVSPTGEPLKFPEVALFGEDEVADTTVEEPLSPSPRIVGTEADMPGVLSNGKLGEPNASLFGIDAEDTSQNEDLPGVLGSEDVFEVPEEILDLSDESSLGGAFAGLSESAVGAIHELPLPGVVARASDPGNGVDFSSADSHIAGGSYYRALEKYKEMLTAEPGNRQVLQRMAELKSFLKMTGKSEEVLIERLEAFRDAIKKGFAGRSGSA